MNCDEDPLRRKPREIDGQQKATGEVCLDGEKNDRIGFQAWADYQSHAIGWQRRKTITMAAQFGYDCHGFEVYLRYIGCYSRY